MACAGDNIDHTANLPDELLHLVFSYLPLRDKLRVESVSRRFRRCVLELMKREPQPLELKTGQRLNGYSVQSGRLIEALRSLAKKAKFDDVQILVDYDWMQNTMLNPHIDTVLFILLESDCLDKVVSFECSYGPSHHILEQVIAKCVKLSTVRFDFVSREPRISRWTPDIDLNRVLNAKALTQLHLRLTAYPRKRLIQLFHSLKPQILQKLGLSFYHEMPTLDLAAMVKQLNTNAWAALREMDLCWETSALVHLPSFFQSLSLLPALEKCHIRLHEDIQPSNQFVAALTALFNSDKKITLSSDGDFLCRGGKISDCRVMAQILRLQKVHPSVGVDFYFNRRLTMTDYDALYLTLSNGTGLFEEETVPWSCGDIHCVDCHRFYPSVLSEFPSICSLSIANGCKDMHMNRYQLDKCRIDTVVERLNKSYQISNENWDLEAKWRALTAETNDAGDLVTIGFETIEDYEDQEPRHFEITVVCGPCFSNSCIRCVDVE